MQCRRALVGKEAHSCRKAWRKVPESEVRGETNAEEKDCSTGKGSATGSRKWEAGSRQERMRTH